MSTEHATPGEPRHPEEAAALGDQPYAVVGSSLSRRQADAVLALR